MITHHSHNPYDVIVIGAGLGGVAAARAVARAGKRVAIVSGSGRSRSLDADGGLVDQAEVERAFGKGAPLGGAVSAMQRVTAVDVKSRPELSTIEETAVRRSFRRLEFERWALDRAIDAGAVFLDGFIEGEVVSGPDGRLLLTEEDGERRLEAGTIALCEGSDPRIAMRAGLRPDYPAEEQIHFARAIIARPSKPVVRTGRTRTSWGMPIGVTATPLGSVTLVTVDSRIENVMRAAKSTQEALMDLRTSRLGEELGLQGDRLHAGTELGAMRSSDKELAMADRSLLLGIDASGMLDIRGIDRHDVTIRAGIRLGEYLNGPREATWQAFATPLVAQVKAPDPRWHTSRRTGYVEESSPASMVRASVSRLARGLAGRLRNT